MKIQDHDTKPQNALQVTLGLVSALMKRGVKVGYQKPVGQQTVPIVCDGDELQVDRDVDIFKHVWPNLIGAPSKLQRLNIWRETLKPQTLQTMNRQASTGMHPP